MAVGRIHSKETFGTVDGPGIRYVLFLQGCPMRCLYCHNPDTWTLTAGKAMTVDEILADYRTYEPYLKNGGITLSGGEPLMQIDFVIALFEAAKKEGIHTALDTSGITFERSNSEALAKFDRLIQSTDLFLLDIKHIDPGGHKALTAHSNEKVLDFLSYLNEHNKELWVRHVIIPGLTYDKELLIRLGQALAPYENIKALDILPYHTMALDKYKELGKKHRLEGVPAATSEQAALAKKIVLAAIKQEREKQE